MPRESCKLYINIARFLNQNFARGIKLAPFIWILCAQFWYLLSCRLDRSIYQNFAYDFPDL